MFPFVWTQLFVHEGPLYICTLLPRSLFGPDLSNQSQLLFLESLPSASQVPGLQEASESVQGLYTGCTDWDFTHMFACQVPFQWDIFTVCLSAFGFVCVDTDSLGEHEKELTVGALRKEYPGSY